MQESAVKDVYAGTIKFYDSTNEACKFVIKQDDDELYITPAYREEPQYLDFSENDRVTYEKINWHIYFSGEDFPSRFSGIPIQTKYVTLESAAVNINKISEG